MTKGLNLSFLRFGIPLLIVSFLALVARSAMFQNSPSELSFGILMDFLITIPVIYFLLIRKSNIPKITTLYVFIAGLLIAGLIIPIEHQELLSRIKYFAIPTIEICVISFVIFKMTKLGSSLKKENGLDFYDKILSASAQVFPGRVGKLLASEIAVFYYLFAKVKKEKTNEEYSYFKKSGITSMICVLIFIIIVETIAIHLLLENWNPTVAWILTGLSLYTLIQITAILRSLKHRLISIDHENKMLHLKYGFACQTSIPFNQIKGIEKTRRTISDSKNHVSLSLFDMLDSKNLDIYLKEENTIQRLYGIEKPYTSISIFVDELETFAEAIEKLISKDDEE